MTQGNSYKRNAFYGGKLWLTQCYGSAMLRGSKELQSIEGKQRNRYRAIGVAVADLARVLEAESRMFPPARACDGHIISGAKFSFKAKNCFGHNFDIFCCLLKKIT